MFSSLMLESKFNVHVFQPEVKRASSLEDEHLVQLLSKDKRSVWILITSNGFMEKGKMSPSC